MNLSVIMPFCPDGGRRDTNFIWAINRIREILPDAEVLPVLQEQLPFSRSMTHNAGAMAATKDVLLFCDADMIFDIDLIEKGLAVVHDAPWVAPMLNKWDFTWDSSNKLLKMPKNINIAEAITKYDLQIDRKWGAERCRAGAMLMITKKNYIEMGGFDERFNGWGYEDNAFMLMAQSTIGSYVETDAIAYHLWHPAAMNQYPQLTQANMELYKEYFEHYEKGDLTEWVRDTGRILK